MKFEVLGIIVVCMKVAFINATPPKYDSRCFGQSDGYMYTNPANCAEYYQCDAGRSVLRKCPPNLYFDQPRQYCNYAHEVKCNGAPAEPDCEIANNGDIFPNPNDCTTFYVCNWNKPVLIKCDPGLNFDPTVNNCNWADLYKCPEAALRP
ncbi:peritrophin-1-like [Culicoides brevitarsis]|uniref:peritrophin-1-like n=1 Tax=Culicoides brevitarsis TaxID=469753 RepID=UPI00307B9577